MRATKTAEDSTMSELTVVKFETSTFSGQTYVSELAEGPPFTVHGIALGADDVTVGQSGIKKMWPADELSQAAESLKGTNLVVDHENNANGVVGQVTKAGYKDGTGVVYQAELYDDELAEKVQSGLLEVSIRGYHADVDSLEEDDDTGAKVVKDIEFDNLSIVPTGAAPSNTLEMGEHAELSAAELSAFTDSLEKAELQEIEPGMWVKWGDNRGITISQVEDGEIEVDIYEEQDGQWRSTEETTMVSTSDLSEWDVDEDNIGPAEDEEKDEEENAATGDKVTWSSSGGSAQGVVRERKTDGCFSDKIDGDQEICADDDDPVVLIEIVKDGEATGTMVAHKESTVSSADFEMEQLEQFSDYPEAAKENAQMALDAREETGNPNDCGTQTGWTRANQLADGEDLSEEVVGKMAAFNRHRKNSEMDDDEGKADCGWMMWKAWGGDEGVDWAKRKMESIEENAAPEFSEGQMVQWQVNPSMFGEIVHVPEDDNIVMIDVHEMEDGEPVSTGFTVTAGFSDIVPMDDSPSDEERTPEEMEAVSQGQFVKWKGADAEWQYGQVIGVNQDGPQMKATLRRFTQDGDKLDETVQKPLQGLDMWDGAPQDGARSDESDMPSSDKSVSDIGVEDVLRVLNAFVSENAVSTKDVPSDDAEPSHEPMSDDDVKRLLLQFVEENGFDATIGEFRDWLDMEKLSDFDRAESEERVLDSIQKLKESRKHDPKWLDSEIEEMAIDDVDEDHMFKDREAAMEKADDLGLDGVHEMDGMWMPGETHEEYMDAVASTSKHMNEEEDEEDMAKHHHEASMEMLDEFLAQEGNNKETFVSAFLEWADDDNARQAVDEFTAEEGNSLETGVGMFQEWLEMKVDESEASGHMDEEMDDSTDEGNSSDVESLQEMEIHTPDFSGTTDASWEKPALEDFGEDPDMSEVAKHFIVSKTGFPPENYGDLALPVVEPDGSLNINALRNAKARGSQVEGLSGEDLDRAMSIINSLAEENFDADFEEAEEHEIDGTIGKPTASKSVGGVRVLSGDDLRDGDKSEESDVDSLTTYKITTMTENIEEKLSELDEPVAVEATEVEELRDKADRFEEMSENLEALRERTDILDDVDRSQVEELAESDESVVVESTRYEELQSEAEQVAGVYAAQLAEEYSAFSADELTDKFSIEELRSKFEEEIGDVEEELASSDDAEPRSQDADEESLEEASDDDSEAEELSESIEEKQDEIRDKILG